jgi:hypothetical protein
MIPFCFFPGFVALHWCVTVSSLNQPWWKRETYDA